MFNRTIASLVLGAGLGAMLPLMANAQQARVKPTVNYEKVIAKLFYRESSCRRYVKFNNGGTKSGAASLQRTAKKLKTARARSSKR